MLGSGVTSVETASKLDHGVSMNRETINDAAKLIMHRLLAWRLAEDPSIVERARVANSSASRRFEGYCFVREWDEILALPIAEIRLQLVTRDSKMTRLRSASPFVGAGIGLADYDRRIRIDRAAKRIVARRLSRSRASTGSA